MNPTIRDHRGRTVGSLRGSRGYTLVECLAATVILAVVLLPLLQLYTGGLRMIRHAGNRTLAVNLARETLEELKEAGYGRLSAELPAGGGGSRREETVEGFPRYSRLVQINPAEHLLPGAALLRLEVTVSWEEQGNKAAVSLVSYLSAKDW